MSTVKLLLLTIQQDDHKGLQTVLDKLPLKTLDPVKANNLLKICLDVAVELNRVDCAKILYNSFSTANPEEDTYSLAVIMIQSSVFSDDHIIIVLRAMNRFTFIDLAEQLTSRDDSQEATEGMHRLIKLYR